MSFWKGLKELFSGGGIIKQAADVADRFIETKSDKREFFIEIYTKEIEERNKAREMYKTDNVMQKIYAATFLAGYLGLTAWLIYAIISGQIKQVNQFETGMIGTIWGGMSAKVNTVTDFFFGSSDQSQGKK